MSILRIATAGSVDDGKSTLIGRLLYDTHSLPVDHMESVTNDEGIIDLAALSDGLRAEREQGITIDVAYRYFSTPKRNYILADTPGHESYTRNMFTGASNADVAIILIDARKGVLIQTRRHALITQLLNVPNIIIAINKMDLVDFQETVYQQINDDIKKLGYKTPPTVIPVNAKDGDNIVNHSPKTPWYKGVTLLKYLETVPTKEEVIEKHTTQDARLPIQYVIIPGNSEPRSYTGKLASGKLSQGDTVTILPGDWETTVTSLDNLNGETTAEEGQSVSIQLENHHDIARSSVIITKKHNKPPILATQITAQTCWFSSDSVKVGERVLIKLATTTQAAKITSITNRINPTDLTITQNPTEITTNDIATLTLTLTNPIICEPYIQNRELGSLILIDPANNNTIAAATIINATHQNQNQKTTEFRPLTKNTPGTITLTTTQTNQTDIITISEETIANEFGTRHIYTPPEVLIHQAHLARLIASTGQNVQILKPFQDADPQIIHTLAKDAGIQVEGKW